MKPDIVNHPFQLQRLGIVMEPEPGNPMEAEDVLNPASACGRDGNLYLFPRLVAHGNYSHIGIARVRFNEAGGPVGVERLGIALEPQADYELRTDAPEVFGPGFTERVKCTGANEIHRLGAFGTHAFAEVAHARKRSTRTLGAPAHKRCVSDVLDAAQRHADGLSQ